MIVDGAAGRLSERQVRAVEPCCATDRWRRASLRRRRRERATLYLIDDRGATPVRARGGIPSLERALRDPETSGVDGWTDTPADRAWAAPDPDEVLLAMDRFHPIPDVPARAESWAEWLYFNGRSGDAVLPDVPGRSAARVGAATARRAPAARSGGAHDASFADSTEVDEADLLAGAPNLTVGETASV